MSDLEFEEYFQRKLEEDKEEIKDLPHSIEQLCEIYRQEYEFKKNMPELELKMAPQPVNGSIVDYFLPEKWEMPRPGRLLYSDEELQNVLKLLVFQLGVKKSLDVIPYELIGKYMNLFNIEYTQEVHDVDNKTIEFILEEEKKERARRNIKIEITDDISHTGLTEEEYRILEDYVDPELNKDDSKSNKDE